MSVPQVDVDFSDPAVIADPFPLYEEIRAAGRVVWNGAVKGWMVPGYADCDEVLGRPAEKAERFGRSARAYPEVTFWFDAPNMIIADGAEHRRLRQGVSGGVLHARRDHRALGAADPRGRRASCSRRWCKGASST